MHQLENGYTKIANSIIEALMRSNFSASCFRVLLWLIRNSYGYNRKEALKASKRKLAKDVNMKPTITYYALRFLVSNKIINTIDNKLVLNKSNLSGGQPIDHPKLVNLLTKTGQPIDQTGQPIDQTGQPIDPPTPPLRRKTTLNTILKTVNTEKERFLTFYKAYPKKVAKEGAWKAWLKQKPPLDTCLKTLNWQKQSKDWIKEDGKYIPHPQTWINRHRWEDEVSEPNIDPDIAEAEFHGRQRQN